MPKISIAPSEAWSRTKLLSSLSDHFLSPPNDLHHSSNIWIWGDTEVRCPSDRSTSVGKERSAHSEVPWRRTLDLSKEVFKLDQWRPGRTCRCTMRLTAWTNSAKKLEITSSIARWPGALRLPRTMKLGCIQRKKDNCKNVMLEFVHIGRRQGSKCWDIQAGATAKMSRP